MKRTIAGLSLCLSLGALLPASASTTRVLPGQSSLVEALEAQLDRAAQSPNDATVLNDLANLQVLTGSLDDAEANYRQALGIDPNNLTIRLNLGLLLQQKGEKRKALKEYRRVAKEQPSNAWAYYQIGSVYADWGYGSRAVKNFARSFSLDLRMTLPDYNPQVINNDLATRALIYAYKDHPIVPLVPRTYAEPSLIRGFFVPTLESMNGATRRNAGGPESATSEPPMAMPEPVTPEPPREGDGFEDEGGIDPEDDDGS